MTITDTSILNYTYFESALFGVSLLWFLATAFHYAIDGRTRISAIARYSTLLFGLAHLACLFDMAQHNFFYIRPTDTVKVYWIRNCLSIPIFPLAVLGIMELLHCPGHESVSEKKSAVHKHGMIEMVYSLSKWIVFILAILGEIFVLPSTLSDSQPVRWAAFSIGSVLSLISIILVFWYYRTYGMRLWKKNTTVVRTSFFGKKTNATEAFVAWICLLIYWLLKVIIVALGHALGLVCSYDVEVAVIMSGQIILIVGCLFACKAARDIHKYSYQVVEQTVFIQTDNGMTRL